MEGRAATARIEDSESVLREEKGDGESCLFPSRLEVGGRTTMRSGSIVSSSLRSSRQRKPV